MAQGAVVVWSGTEPRLEVLRFGAQPVVLGRDRMDERDHRISLRHALLTLEDGELVVVDLESKNGTFINGERIAGRTTCRSRPAVIRTGHTLSVILDDVRPYENATLVRHGNLVVGASLANAWRILERAALEESHVGLIGPMTIGRELAKSYAEIVGGTTVHVDLGVVRLDTFGDQLAEKRPRTIILELARPLTLPDQPELEQWLETEIRIVTVARGWDSFTFMPKELVARVTPRAIELPQLRIDELPMTIADRVRARAPSATIHVTFIEAALLHARNMNEESLLRNIDSTLAGWLSSGESVLRGEHLHRHIEAEAALKNCLHGVPPRRRR